MSDLTGFNIIGHTLSLNSYGLGLNRNDNVNHNVNISENLQNAMLIEVICTLRKKL